MKPNSARLTFCCFLFFCVSGFLNAQTAATLTGIIKDDSGKPIPNAAVSVKNVASGKSAEVRTASDGTYSAPSLDPGDYEVSASAKGFDTRTEKISIAAGSSSSLNIALNSALSLQGLGFPSSVTTGNPQEQARLDKRSHMLKIHQRLGLITTAPLVATVLTGSLAGGHATSSTDRNLHAVLGSTTAGLYFTSAYYAMFAPKIPGTQSHGNIRLHKALAWIHGPGMVLTPILGAMAYSQKSNGEKVHGIASIHGPVGIITAGAYGAAILSVSLHTRRSASSDGQQ